MKNKNACASALIKLCNVKLFPCKYALWRQIKRSQCHIYGGCASLCANELGPLSLNPSEFGTDLNLPSISVYSVSGLSFDNLLLICILQPTPKYLVIHVGENDICKHNNPLSRQLKLMKNVIQCEFGHATDLYHMSHILPRVYWRHAIWYLILMQRNLDVGLIVMLVLC
jgi:hypothetical protein